jgi:hypothetical protein
MMFIRSLADFNGTPWAVQVTVGAITVTAQATSSPDRHDKQGSGDFYLATNGDIHLAISGDLQLATNGDFHMATDSWDAGGFEVGVSCHRVPTPAASTTFTRAVDL